MTVLEAASLAAVVYVPAMALGALARRRWKADGSGRSVSIAGRIAALECIEAVSASAFLIMLAVGLAVALLASAPTPLSAGAIAVASALDGLALVTDGWLGRGLVASVTLTLAVVWRREARAAIHAAYDVARLSEVDRLWREFETGPWAAQPPSPAMEHVVALTREFEAELAGLKPRADAALYDELRAMVAQCRRVGFGLDVQRRLRPDFSRASALMRRPRLTGLSALLLAFTGPARAARPGRRHTRLALAMSVVLWVSLVGWAGEVADARGAVRALHRALPRAGSNDGQLVPHPAPLLGKRGHPGPPRTGPVVRALTRFTKASCSRSPA